MASMKDSFYVTLPSHDPNEIYLEKNKPNDFTIKLPETLFLDVLEWEVGLSEIFVPDYGYNLKSPRNESVKITYPRNVHDENGDFLLKANVVDYIGLREGRYTAKSWVRSVNDRIKETMYDPTTKEHLYLGRLRYHEVQNKIEVVLGMEEGMAITDEMLVHMTGWEGKNFELVNLGTSGKIRQILPYSCKFDVNGEQMMVYTDIIDYSTVGSQNVALLRTVHLEPEGRPCHRECTEIQYHGLRVENISTIHIILLNTYGEPMDFMNGSHCTVVLHFRRRSTEKMRKN